LAKSQRDFCLDLPASLRANIVRGGGEITFSDLRKKQFQHRQRALIVFVIDASESMGEGTLERMKAAKGAILALLTAAYQNRDQVALVAFRDQQAEVLLRPTSSVLLAQQQLRKLPLGGATPFADGLWQAWQLVRCERQKQPNLQPLLVVISDGEANVPLVAGTDIYQELNDIARQIGQDKIGSVVIDSMPGVGNPRLQELARKLAGSYRQIRELHAGKLLAVVRNGELRQGVCSSPVRQGGG
jgi:magnesium chelatase subunit D